MGQKQINKRRKEEIELQYHQGRQNI